MHLEINRAVAGVEAPPIAEAMSWVADVQSNRALANFCQAVPSYPPAAELQQELARRVMLPETSVYTDISGTPALRAALAQHMSRDYAGEVTAADVVITAGCNQAFCTALTALAGPGDNVILPAPWYFNHQMWLAMQGIEIRSFNAVSESGCEPQAGQAAPLIDGRTKAIILVSPNNPTGGIFPPAVIAEFYELARSHGIALVLDETYKDFRDDPAPPHDLFQRPGWRDTLVQLYSFSKVYALTGYRTGSVVAGPRILAEVAKVLDCVAICAPRIGQDAALYGLTALDAWKAEKAQMMRDRLTALRTAFADPRLKYRLVSSGAYFAYVRHPFTGESAKSVAMRLAREQQLLCLPGSMFGPGQEQHLRIAFANAGAEMMPELVARLIESQGG